VRTFETRTRVRYSETDASGIAYYNQYFVYFELGRVEMFRELGLPYDFRLPIAETYCRYHASAAFDDPLRIDTTLEEVRSAGFRLGHGVFRERPGEEPLLLVEGWTAMVTTGEDHRPAPLPPAFAEAFRELTDANRAG
jgi:acyl-CoA thioester hydrolase